MESFIQYAEGYQKENVKFSDVKKAIKDIIKMDDEHGAFWVSVNIENENTIEVHKNKEMNFHFSDGFEKKYQAETWDEVKGFYKQLLNNNFDAIKSSLI